MKNKLLLTVLFLSFVYSYGQVTISPFPFEVNQSITITVDTNSNATDCNGFSSPNKVYLHSGVGPDANPWTHVIGNWGQDDGVGEMTSNGNGTWSITFVPETYYGLSASEAAAVTRMGMVFRNENGSQEFKDNGCSDFFFDVGAFQLSLTSPSDDITITTSGATINIQATSTQTADFTLKANGSTVDTQNGITSYSLSPTVNTTTSYVLEANNGTETLSRSFQVIVNPTVVQEAIPSGIEEGINYDAHDPTKVTLALKAPNKDYIYVAGSFNNYEFDNNYVMKQDTDDPELYWLEITGLTSGQPYTYQYWVIDESPIANSPQLVKVADPYSTLVLSPFDDPGIPSASFPNIPTYPAGQEREVTLIQTGQTPYNWVVTNFDKPKKEDLVVYEVLIRDFDANRTFQDLIDRIDYFKNLKINAIELMPIMEYEGNESWGYNTSFHTALDKYYGTPEKFKEFVDLCHQNGIAVILDIALNHAFGRNPLVRMWMDDPDNDGWGNPSSENPYFNQLPMHSFNVGSDFNHQSTLTQNYVKKVVSFWIQEYKIDGFRWDLTKGFTQNCGNGTFDGDFNCTNNYQQDRVDVLKSYADHSWNVDPTHYVIFEHLGQDNEEQQWANYRLGDAIPKGIMMWGKMTNEYTDFVQGYSNNISRATHTSRGFTAPRLMMYPESHDEERVMYETVTTGNSSNSSHNPQNLDIALKRMASMGAISLTLPGPKMIWHFGALGMDNSIFTCSNGSVNSNCRLDTKPQPQWSENWLGDADRSLVYDTWARLIDLKIHEPVFEGDFSFDGTSQNVRLHLFDTSLPAGQLNNVVILANFNVIDQSINPNFPSTGTWYNLMDNTPVTITGTTDPILVPAGEFIIYGNQQTTLSNTENPTGNDLISMYPNPTRNGFQINTNTDHIVIYNLLGKMIAEHKGDFPKGHVFPTNRMEKGVYIVRIKSEQGSSIKKLIVE
ncbi:alpha-amylase family glycosyl hydrolase [Pseudotenacibaculum haliotis]|uniref:Alpha-amylase family glycosyl hydrolase n=1 Tax=Pseudotenacibaculum haliotis TaxID=1862138 RepID=A0ABW5LS11_9FLAO